MKVNNIDIMKYELNDIATSEMFFEYANNDLLYIHDVNAWYYYTGQKWEQDNSSGIMSKRFMKNLAKYCKEFIKAYNFPDLETEKAYETYYNRVGKASFRNSILDDSKTEFNHKFKEFNSHKQLFNCTNGTYDLESGGFRNHSPEDMLTDISNVTYDPNAKCPRFNKFIDEIMECDIDKANYLLEAMAYCLSGDTQLECFFILYGPTSRNGKGTLMTLMMELLGDYAYTLNNGAIISKTNVDPSKPSPHWAKLLSARMANINETNSNFPIDSALIKTLTGGDSLVTRNLFEGEKEYTPQFKIFINSNHLPKMNDDTVIKSDRLHLICFNKHFIPEERDTSLKETLKEEIPGIFNLLVEKYRNLKARGNFQVPNESKEELYKYLCAVDSVQNYVDENLEKDSNACEKLKNLYDDYTYWCSENDLKPLSKNEFKTKIDEKNIRYLGKVNRKNIHGLYENTYWCEGVKII